MKRTPLRRKTRLKAKRSRPRRSARVRDVAYLAFIRTLPCAISLMREGILGSVQADHECDGDRIHAHHAGPRPFGRKADDNTAIPLCPKHHSAIHDLREPFRSMTAAERHAWVTDAIAWYQDEFQAREAA